MEKRSLTEAWLGWLTELLDQTKPLLRDAWVRIIILCLIAIFGWGVLNAVAHTVIACSNTVAWAIGYIALFAAACQVIEWGFDTFKVIVSSQTDDDDSDVVDVEVDEEDESGAYLLTEAEQSRNLRTLTEWAENYLKTHPDMELIKLYYDRRHYMSSYSVYGFLAGEWFRASYTAGSDKNGFSFADEIKENPSSSSTEYAESTVFRRLTQLLTEAEMLEAVSQIGHDAARTMHDRPDIDQFKIYYDRDHQVNQFEVYGRRAGLWVKADWVKGTDFQITAVSQLGELAGAKDEFKYMVILGPDKPFVPADIVLTDPS